MKLKLFNLVNLHQATAVALELEKLFAKSGKKFDHIEAGEYENGREHGFSLNNTKTHNAVSWAENRNSDDIVVYPASTFDFDASWMLTTDEKYFECRKYFGCGSYELTAKFIYKFITQAKAVPYGVKSPRLDPTCPQCGDDKHTSRNSSDMLRCENCGYDEGDEE